MKSTNLVTAFGNAADLVSNSLCKTTPPADNCKVEKNFIVALAQPPVPPKDFQPGRRCRSDMTFAIVRSNLAGCEPLCPEWIFADGKITADTPALFRKFWRRPANGGCPLLSAPMAAMRLPPWPWAA